MEGGAQRLNYKITFQSTQIIITGLLVREMYMYDLR